MNNLKEKLVELIDEAPVRLKENGRLDLEVIADYLIANGVTIQRWISVEERLPEDSDEVNLCTRSGIVGIGYYDKYRKNWVQYYAGGALCVDVTHWMPLPKPPKGE